MSPKVYLIVLNYNNWPDTVCCLETLLRQDYPNFQVLVVDNGSRDDSVEQILHWAEGSLSCPHLGDSPHDRLLASPLHHPIDCVHRSSGNTTGDETERIVILSCDRNLGFAGGNNVALRYVQARKDAQYIWLINNDTVVHPAALSELVTEAGADAKIGIAGSTVLLYNSPDVSEFLGGGQVSRWHGMTRHLYSGLKESQLPERTVCLDYICGASMLIKSTVLEAVGLFDERFFLYGEDADMCLRATKGGWKLAAARRSVVWHKGGGTIGSKSQAQDYHVVRSVLLLVRKHFPKSLIISSVYLLGKALLPKVLRFQLKRLKAVTLAFWDSLLNQWDRRRFCDVAEAISTSSNSSPNR